MTTPIVKHRGRGPIQEPASTGNTKGKATAGLSVTLSPSDPCPRCGDKGHLLSDHIEERARQCTKCACVAQDTDS